MQKIIIICTSLILSVGLTEGKVESLLVLDEYQLVRESEFSIPGSTRVDIRELFNVHLKPLMENSRRSWLQCGDSTFVKQPNYFRMSDNLAAIEIEGCIYAVRRLAQRFAEGNLSEEDYEIEKDSTVVYRFTSIGWPTSHQLKVFFVWNGQWIIEYFNHVVIEGVNLNKKLGYDKIFGYRMLCGRPFYFFEKNGLLGVNFNDEIVTAGYTRIPHYWCCDYSLLNPKHHNNFVEFFAVKDGYWHFVRIGLSD